MLVLSRKNDEWIQIGPDVTVKILRIKGGTVRIGIEAPESVEVLRGELIGASNTDPCETSRSRNSRLVSAAK